MGDNENLEIVSPTQESNVLNNCDVDLSPIIETLKDLAIKQGEIIENQNKVIKYFIPTEEEIKKQEKLKKEQEKKELEELEQQKIYYTLSFFLKSLFYLHHLCRLMQMFDHLSLKHGLKHMYYHLFLSFVQHQ